MHHRVMRQLKFIFMKYQRGESRKVSIMTTHLNPLKNYIIIVKFSSSTGILLFHPAPLFSFSLSHLILNYVFYRIFLIFLSCSLSLSFQCSFFCNNNSTFVSLPLPIFPLPKMNYLVRLPRSPFYLFLLLQLVDFF